MGAIRQHWQIIALLGILGLAVFFRFYLIAEIPPGLYPDEAANGNNAVEALRTGSFRVFYPENNGREGLFINLQALAVMLLGAEPWVLRAVAALAGTLTVLAVYLAGRELFLSSPQKSGGDTAVPFLSAFFLATSFWHINFSRIGFRAIMLPLAAAFALYWLSKALRTGKISSALAAGAATGLGLQTYIGFRFMPFVLAVPIAFALANWLKRKASLPAIRYPLSSPCIPCITALFLFAVLAAALPLGLYFLNHPADFIGRSGQVSIFSAASPLYEFARSNLLTFGMLFVRGDCNPRHNLACQSQLFWPVGAFFLIGLALSIRGIIKNWKGEMGNATLLAWLIFMAFPATLTREGLPHALRAIGMIPPAMIIAAMGGVWLWRSLNVYFDGALVNPKYAAYRGQLKRIKKELAIAAILILILIPAYAYRDYFVRFAYSPATADAFAADLLEKGRLLRMLPAGTEKIILVNMSGQDIRGVPAPAQTVMFASDSFDPERRGQKRISYVADAGEIDIDAPGTVVIIPLNPDDASLRGELQRRFPALRAKVIGNFTIFQNSP